LIPQILVSKRNATTDGLQYITVKEQILNDLDIPEESHKIANAPFSDKAKNYILRVHCEREIFCLFMICYSLTSVGYGRLDEAPVVSQPFLLWCGKGSI
jgi:hypothetical protein